jgi:beta-lactamase class A
MKGKSFLQYLKLSLSIYSKPLGMLLCLVFSVSCFAASSEAQLVKKIYNIEKGSSAIIGITAIHIETNKIIGHNSNKRFFMASTIKLPIALAFLHLVDQKKDSLNRVINLGLSNSVPGSGTLHYMCEKRRIRMSLQQILKYMLANSDNSASDAILQTVNGPAYVTKRMHALGFKNILINRSIIEMMMDTNHIDPSFLKTPHTVHVWKKIFNNTPVKQKILAWQRFEKDTRDTTTPNEMAKLLVKIYKKEALSESSTKVLMSIMEKCKTGRSRIRGLLPPQVKVAHKTGTWAIDEPQYIRYPGSNKLFRFVSDVGIITLPKNKGHIAIAVYIKSQAVSNYTRNRAIALASRAIYDHFMIEK